MPRSRYFNVASNDGKRRLRVIQPKEEEGEERPPLQWSVIGGSAVLLAWVPLAMLVSALNAKIVAAIWPSNDAAAFQAAWQTLSPMQRMGYGALQTGTHLLGFASACILGGMLVGRFGGGAGKKEAMISGIGAASIAALALGWPTLSSFGILAWLVNASVMVGIGGLTARWGGSLGLRLRARA